MRSVSILVGIFLVLNVSLTATAVSVSEEEVAVELAEWGQGEGSQNGLGGIPIVSTGAEGGQRVHSEEKAPRDMAVAFSFSSGGG